MKIRVAAVRFTGSSKRYDFFTDLDLKKGDTVVCDTSMGTHTATVIEVKATTSSHQATKWVIQLVDMDGHRERLSHQAKVEELRKKMEARRKQLQNVEIYRMLADVDPVMAGLLDEYNELNKSTIVLNA